MSVAQRLPLEANTHPVKVPFELKCPPPSGPPVPLPGGMSPPFVDPFRWYGPGTALVRPVNRPRGGHRRCRRSRKPGGRQGSFGGAPSWHGLSGSPGTNGSERDHSHYGQRRKPDGHGADREGQDDIEDQDPRGQQDPPPGRGYGLP